MAKKTRTSPQDAPKIIIAEEMQPEEILVSCEAGIITSSDIQKSINEYLAKLHDPNDIYSNKPLIFNGLLEHIYTRNLQRILGDNTYNDYDLINTIFYRIYINLCYSFSYIPLLTVFTNHLVHIDINNIYSIKNGIRFTNDSNGIYNNKLYSYILKWIEVCDSDLFTHIAHTGSIGGMFLAKVKGYSDQPQQQITIELQTPRIDEKQLTRLAATPAPELPDNMP